MPWQYEQEYRTLYEPELEEHKGVTFSKVAPNMIAEVLIGPSPSHTFAKEVENCLNGNPSFEHVRMKRVEFSPTTFELIEFPWFRQ